MFNQRDSNYGAVVTTVGIVTIALGVIVLCTRGALLVAPAPVLRWMLELMQTKGRIRVFGAFAVAIGAVMIWAGASEESTLATILSVIGWGFLAISVPLLVLFPGAYQAIVKAVLPSVETTNLTAWRLRGLIGAAAGAVLIYFGVLAL